MPKKKKNNKKAKEQKEEDFDLQKLKIPRPEVTSSSWNLKSMKKPTYAFSLFLGICGILIALILLLVINDALDKTEKAVAGNLDGAYTLFADIEDTVSSFEKEVIALNSTFDDLGGSISSLASGMNKTGSTIKDFGSTLSQISIPGFSLTQQGQDLNSAGDDIIAGSNELKSIGELSEHKSALAQLKNSLNKIKNDIITQKHQIAETKKSISDVFGLIKLANFLVFILFITLFGVQILNSIAGVL